MDSNTPSSIFLQTTCLTAMLLFLWVLSVIAAPPPVYVVTDSNFVPTTHVQFLSSRSGYWTYTPTDDPAYAAPGFDDTGWYRVSPAEILLSEDAPDSLRWTGIGWFRMRFTIDSTLAEVPLFWRVGTWGGLTLHIDGVEQASWGRPHDHPDSVIHDHPLNQLPVATPTRLVAGRTYVMAVRYANHQEPMTHRWLNTPTEIDPLIRLAKPAYAGVILDSTQTNLYYNMPWIASLVLLSFIFLYFSLLNRHDRLIASTFTFTLLLTVAQFANSASGILDLDHIGTVLARLVFELAIGSAIPLMAVIMSHVVGRRPPRFAYVMLGIWPVFLYVNYVVGMGLVGLILYVLAAGALVAWRVWKDWASMRREAWIILTGVTLVVVAMITTIIGENLDWYLNSSWAQFVVVSFIYLSIPIAMLVHITLSYTRLNQERNQRLQKEVDEATAQLKATMDQLVQQEKLASLGQLTAGIAHEIKNPLNFVNNFASVSLELLAEAKAEADQLASTFNLQPSTLGETLSDVEMNLKKIHEHGTRADKIVKSMLLHSRGGSGRKEPTDLNAFLQEYANLAYHGMRAGKDPIQADIRFELDPKVGVVPIVAEDFSRVILNLCNNAFDAMRDSSTFNLQPSRLTVRTKRTPDAILIEIEDNGPGVPDELKSKILEPFFTTKKGTDGTGLGLSISMDIIRSHGARLDIEDADPGARFVVSLPSAQ